MLLLIKKEARNIDACAWVRRTTLLVVALSAVRSPIILGGARAPCAPVVPPPTIMNCRYAYLAFHNIMLCIGNTNTSVSIK